MMKDFEAFNEVISLFRVKPHVWGQTDCFCFVNMCMWAKTGKNYFGATGLRYGSYKEALKVMGGFSIERMFDRVFDRVSPMHLSTGDVGFTDNHIGGLKAPHVVVGEKALARGVNGLIEMSRLDLVKGYKIA